MPTSATAQAAVAATLGGADPSDPAAVAWFYRSSFPRYPAPARALIADFLVGSAGTPPAGALARLKDAVSAFPPLQSAARPPREPAEAGPAAALARLGAHAPRVRDLSVPGRV